jgi:hypothetical protein
MVLLNYPMPTVPLVSILQETTDIRTLLEKVTESEIGAGETEA